MNVQRIEQIAQAEMAGCRSDTREPGWILYHGQRTGKLAVVLAQKLNYDVDCDVLTQQGSFTTSVREMIRIMKREHI